MDDKFLYRLREQPDAGFTKNLYEHLARNLSEPGRIKKMDMARIWRSINLQWAVALFFVFILVLTTISPVRALVSSLITRIAELSFVVTDNYPGDDTGDEVIVSPEIMPLEEALAIFPHDIHMPAYIPAGYELDENVRVYMGESAGPFANTIELDWKSNGAMSYILRITDQNSWNQEIVAPASAIEEIMLDNNHSAVVIHGGWDVDSRTWNTEKSARLKWLVNDLTYDLMGNNQDQLVEIALSTLE